MAIAFVASGSAVEVSGTPIATPISVTVAITANHTAIAVVHFGASGGAVTSLTNGGTWTKICEITNNGLAAYHSELWATGVGASATASSVSVAWSGSPEAISVEIADYSGIAALGNNATNRSGSASANPNVALTLQDANNFIIAGGGAWDTTAFTVSGGNTIRKQQSGSGSSDIIGALLDNTQAGTGSITATLLHASNEWTMVAVEARSTTGGGAPPFIGARTVFNDPLSSRQSSGGGRRYRPTTKYRRDVRSGLFVPESTGLLLPTKRAA